MFYNVPECCKLILKNCRKNTFVDHLSFSKFEILKVVSYCSRLVLHCSKDLENNCPKKAKKLFVEPCYIILVLQNKFRKLSKEMKKNLFFRSPPSPPVSFRNLKVFLHCPRLLQKNLKILSEIVKKKIFFRSPPVTFSKF